MKLIDLYNEIKINSPFKKLKMQKSNWGDDQDVEILVNYQSNQMKVPIYGDWETFTLEFHEDDIFEEYVVIYWGDNKMDWFGFKSNNIWDINNSAGNISRSDENPFIATAQLIFNVL